MKRIMYVVGLTLLLISTNSFSDSVIRDGKEWLQPTLFTDLTWNDVEDVCPEPDFLCNGELKGFDVTGYTFASIDDITELFNSYGIDPPLESAPSDTFALNSTWRPAFFLDFVSEDSLEIDYLYGWSASRVGALDARVAYLQGPDQQGYDRAGNDITSKLNSEEGWLVFLYRDVPPVSPRAVPTMSTYMLLITILGLIAIASGGLFRRKFKDG